MTTPRYAALAAHPDDGLTAYGPFDNRTDARLTTSQLGTSDPNIIATRHVTLHPPDSVTGSSTWDNVIELPDPIARLIRHHNTQSTMDTDGAVVMLAVLTTPRDHALLVGPFDTVHAARTWHRHSHDPITRRVAECYPLPLRHGHTDTHPPATATAPAVIVLDVDNATVVYGPFTNGMDAALFWHDLTTTLTLTNVHHVHICELTPPTPSIPSGHNPRPAEDRTRGWVVRLEPDNHDEPTLIGPFPDQHTARTWRDTTTATTPPAAVLPIYRP